MSIFVELFFPLPPFQCLHMLIHFNIILQGILLVYDITNGWSFDGIDRWIREIDEVIPFSLYSADEEIQEMDEKYCVLSSVCLHLFLSDVN